MSQFVDAYKIFAKKYRRIADLRLNSKSSHDSAQWCCIVESLTILYGRKIGWSLAEQI
jgi:hypothetical protein